MLKRNCSCEKKKESFFPAVRCEAKGKKDSLYLKHVLFLSYLFGGDYAV